MLKLLMLVVILLLPGIPASDSGVETSGARPHPPILIESDADFESPLSGVTGGRGTAEDPYVIEGWRITPVSGYGIKLTNTQAHVIIRNNRVLDGEPAERPCHLDVIVGYGRRCVPPLVCYPAAGLCVQVPVPQEGIVVRRASNVTVADNVIVGNTVGIHLDETAAVSILRNRISRVPDERTASHVTYQVAESVEEQLSGVFSPTLLVFWPLDTTAVKVHDARETILSDNHLVGNSSNVGGTAIETARNSNFSIRRNTIAGFPFGIVGNRSSLQVEENDLEDTRLSWLRQGTSAVFARNRFATTRLDICGQGTDVVLRENVFGWSVLAISRLNDRCPSDNLRAEVSSNVFRESGLWMSVGNAVGNEFSGGALWVSEDGDLAAVRLEKFQGQFERNLVAASDVGVASDDSTGLISRNTLVMNRAGLVTYGLAKPLVRENLIMANTEFSLFNTDANRFSFGAPPGLRAVDARMNWWGSASGPSYTGPNRLYGAVSYAPWLTEPPSSAV